MASTIKVDNVQNQPGTNIVSKCGTDITLGQSGDTIALACGASQTGFGRTGTVDWVTTIQTSTPFTAVSGKGYFINTTSGTITMNLPTSPSVGDIVAIKDYAGTFNSNNLTIGRGGSNMNGTAEDSVRNTRNESLTLVYADATKGWMSVEEGTGFVGKSFIVATGGTPCAGATCGDYKVHTFTGPGTFCVSALSSTPACNAVAYMVVAGGGGSGNCNYSGGGGAGGFREGTTSPIVPYTASPIAAATGLTVTASPYPIVVGGGGAGGTAPVDNNRGRTGNDSSFDTITSAGGGGGGAYIPTPTCSNRAGLDGGSGGGGASNAGVGGAGDVPSTTPDQGFPGGNGTGSSGGGGGGATTIGGNGIPAPRAGGTGATTNIPGSSITKSTGGDGGPGSAVPAGCNTGDGGGKSAGVGGSGIVVIRYKFQ